MRIVVQRVSKCQTSINNNLFSTIEKGLLIFVGIEDVDDVSDADWLVSKICSMRIFSDAEGKMNLDVKQIGGDLLVVSQFTLHASTQKGNRPSFIKAAKPDKAMHLYDHFVQKCDVLMGRKVKTGKFGADMQISLVNDGPVTIQMDSKNRE
jgi:D-tyrosyl-tRNA(Tyr) deacylase